MQTSRTDMYTRKDDVAEVFGDVVEHGLREDGAKAEDVGLGDEFKEVEELLLSALRRGRCDPSYGLVLRGVA